ncbi:MAG: HD domain-containing phosphohydrolase [Thermodesulfobacteriota bacterium]
MSTPIHVLLIEDSEIDALMIVRELRRGGFEPAFERVETAEGLEAALQKQAWDLILADHKLPHFSDVEALKLVKEQGLDLPFIIVSGTIGEEAAVSAMKAGAYDYVLKDNLTRLTPAINRSLEEARVRRKRKEAEEALRESEERYRKVVENAHEAVFIIQDERIIFFNSKTGDLFGYRPEDPVPDLYFLDHTHPEDKPLVLERHHRRLRGEEIPDGYSFRVVDRQGNIKWVEVHSALIKWQGKPASLVFLNDISDRKQAEEKVIEGAEQLRRAMEGIVQAMAATVDVKDPYTAGHQRRVADLARNIALELGLDQGKCEGIHMAGMIHDIGKLSVPAEILSKPTQLSPIEINLIRVHPQAGYDILKGVEFPWPVAQMVLQHHERVNGSGYPNGLKGEVILPEAMILAVADVVEAIASYRPYRPALGIEKALEEIETNQGILYDPAVVGGCLRLFREKGYQLK